MSKLDSIFLERYGETIGKGNIVDIIQQVKDLMFEQIGENEIRPSEGPKRNGIEQGLRRTRNKLRNEWRQKVNEL